MDETHFTVTVFLGLLLVASGVAMATKWLRVPYTLLLVVVGLVISPMHFLPVAHISPELILLVFLPALLFEAAWNLKLEHLRENWLPIATLAVVGVSLSVGVIGGILHVGAGLPLQTSLLFGAMISATDPVSVLAIFKKLSLPTRLSTIVEGESLFNDGTAVVVFRIILGVVMGATAGTPGELALSSVRDFVVVVFGGVVVGTIVGTLASRLTSYFEDYLLEITLTTVAAYGSFLAAEELHVSGVLAVLVAGLIIGNYGRHIGMSATTQVAVNSFWEYAAFVVNSLVFLLIGLEVQLPELLANIHWVAWAIVAMLLGRVVAVYGLMPIANLFSDPLPFRWQHVLVWGGLRGSLSIALALSVPTAVEGRPLLVMMVFGTVLFSLLAQGLTMAPVIKGIGLAKTDAPLQEYELVQSRLLANTAALAELDSIRGSGVITEHLYHQVRESLLSSQEELAKRLTTFDLEARTLEREQERRIRRHLLDVKRARVTDLYRDGMVSERSYEELNRELAEELGEIAASDAAH